MNTEQNIMNILLVLFIFNIILNTWIVIFSRTFYHSARMNLKKNNNKQTDFSSNTN